MKQMKPESSWVTQLYLQAFLEIYSISQWEIFVDELSRLFQYVCLYWILPCAPFGSEEFKITKLQKSWRWLCSSVTQDLNMSKERNFESNKKLVSKFETTVDSHAGNPSVFIQHSDVHYLLELTVTLILNNNLISVG